MLDISGFTVLHFSELLIRQGPDIVGGFESFFLTNDGSLVVILKSDVVCSETFNKLIIFLLFIVTTISGDLAENAVAEDKDEHPQGTGVVSHEQRVHVGHCRRDVMLGESNVTLEFNLFNLCLEDLSVSKLPEGHGKHDIGHPLDEIESEHGHLLIECGRFAIVVADEEALVNVKDNEGEACDGIERWHGATIAESNADLKQDHGVSVMDKVAGTGVGVDVALNGE